MSLFSHDTLAGRVAAEWTRKRAVVRLTERLERFSDRRLADIGIARADIAQVALAAYPTPAVAAADLRVRSPLVFAGAASQG